MKRQLAETEEIRSSFIANVSHDLRTPLTSINGFVEGMLDGIIKIEDYPKYLKIIKSETGRLNRLTSDILQTAKIQSGKIELNKQYIHASEMFVSVVEKMKKLAEEKSISITVECDEETIVHADGDRLYQVLDNVIGNAIKYTVIGGGIRLKAMYVGSGVEFSISDTGEGISEENLLHVFERFYRTDKSRSSVNGGSGLGLSIAKNLVELHGGSIRAESIQGDGTTIIFDIPK